MKGLNSLRGRLMLAYTGLILVGFAGLALLAGRQISAGAVEDYRENLVTQAALVARGLTESVEHFRENEMSQPALTQRVQQYAEQVDAHVVLIDRSGRPWLASSDPMPTGSQQSRAEVAAALEGRMSEETRSDGSGEMRLYAAAPIMEDGQVLSVVSLDAPLVATRSLVAQRWLTLGGGVLALTLLALLASSWLASSLTRPLGRLRSSALKMAGGDLSQRLPAQRNDEIGELARAFNHMAARVEAMLEEQRAFASNASHELRTPLTTIRLRSEALRGDSLDEGTRQQYIVEIDQEAQRLSALVDDLLLLSRLDSGRAQPGQQQVDVARLLHHLLREYEETIRARGLAVKLEVGRELPPVTASLNHLRVVLRNLLDNAVKYTPEGGSIVCRVQVKQGGLQLTVRDSGRGIHRDDLPYLFDRFYRADKARTREVAGVGLGLALVEGVVRAYGGRVAIDSPGLGEGTTVQLWWPLQPPAAQPATPASEKGV